MEPMGRLTSAMCLEDSYFENLDPRFIIPNHQHHTNNISNPSNNPNNNIAQSNTTHWPQIHVKSNHNSLGQQQQQQGMSNELDWHSKQINSNNPNGNINAIGIAGMPSFYSSGHDQEHVVAMPSLSVAGQTGNNLLKPTVGGGAGYREQSSPRQQQHENSSMLTATVGLGVIPGTDILAYIHLFLYINYFRLHMGILVIDF